jgi:hypothetical protein
MSYPAPALAPASAPSAQSDGFSFNNNSFGNDAPTESSSPTSLLVRAVLIVLLLALIGFNVMTYLDDITQWVGETFGAPFRAVARFLGYAAIDTARTTVDVSAQGTKSAVDIAAGAATSGIDVLQQTIEQKGRQEDTDTDTDQPGQPDQPSTKNASQMSSSGALQRALSHAKKQPPQPDDATSRTQRTGKSGYCYIGEDRGFRSCIKVGEEDTCMSGDIFPTHAICINPRLRK